MVSDRPTVIGRVDNCSIVAGLTIHGLKENLPIPAQFYPNGCLDRQPLHPPSVMATISATVSWSWGKVGDKMRRST
jgi:hypothetical protein